MVKNINKLKVKLITLYGVYYNDYNDVEADIKKEIDWEEVTGEECELLKSWVEQQNLVYNRKVSYTLLVQQPIVEEKILSMQEILQYAKKDLEERTKEQEARRKKTEARKAAAEARRETKRKEKELKKLQELKEKYEHSTN